MVTLAEYIIIMILSLGLYYIFNVYFINYLINKVDNMQYVILMFSMCSIIISALSSKLLKKKFVIIFYLGIIWKHTSFCVSSVILLKSQSVFLSNDMSFIAIGFIWTNIQRCECG